MGVKKKEKKEHPLWFLLTRGILLSLGIYLLGILFLAWGAVRGIVNIESSFAMIAILSGLSVFLGASSVVRMSPWGTLPTASIVASAFICILALFGVSFWEQLTWNGGILSLCALSGGGLAAIFGGHIGKKKRRF